MLLRALTWLLCAGGAGLALVQPVTAYTVGSGSTANGPTGEPSGAPFPFVATFVQPDGSPVPAGIRVTFSEIGGPGLAALEPAPMLIGGRWQRVALAASACWATFSPATTVTNSGGRAVSTVVLPGGCPGQFVLEAMLSSGGIVTLTVVEIGGFPNTTADPAHATPWFLIAAGAVVLSVLAAGGIRLWSALLGRWN